MEILSKTCMFKGQKGLIRQSSNLYKPAFPVWYSRWSDVKKIYLIESAWQLVDIVYYYCLFLILISRNSCFINKKRITYMLENSLFFVKQQKIREIAHFS